MLFPIAVRLGQRSGQLSWDSVWDSAWAAGRQDSILATGARRLREQVLVPGASTKWALHIVTSLGLLQAVSGTRGLRELGLASMVPRDTMRSQKPPHPLLPRT